jgi:hypothetical protein
MEAYNDDVVIKTKNSENFIEDLQQVFNSLRRYRWKLNPEKCVFGVPTKKLLGFIISHRGIKANPEKNQSYNEDGTTTVTEKGAKAYGMHGSAKPFYFKTQRKGDAIL